MANDVSKLHEAKANELGSELEATTAKTPPRRGRRPAATTAAKANGSGKAPANKAPANAKAPAPAKSTGDKAAPAKANGDKTAAKAPANGSGHAAGFAGYLTRPVADQMPKFRRYIERETGSSIAELAAADPDRLVQMISKGYRFYQQSDLNR